MSYDLYVGRPQGDAVTQLRLLVTNPDQALRQYTRLAHGTYNRQTQQRTPPALNTFIADQLQRLRALNINPPPLPDLSALPPSAWFLQFTFTLAKPWLSKDDEPFYVAESVNPVRKDKVFKVPVMAASSWKGLLRWTAMHTRLVLRKDALSPEEFAHERYAQALLFGDEKGEEPGQTKDFAAYLDRLKPEARALYERSLRHHFQIAPDQPLPHFSGRLVFYPTFFDQIDVEVINPHSRKTRAGTHPIYLECVPAGATGTFSLLYVPFDLVTTPDKARRQAATDLVLVAESIRDMMLTYGFSAKRSSGFGLAQDQIEGEVHTQAGKKPLTRLSQLVQEVKDVAF